MSYWSHDGLWAKAVIYAQRATDEDRDGPLFPLWATLALEFVARACLAKVHPALLADPREGGICCTRSALMQWGLRAPFPP